MNTYEIFIYVLKCDTVCEIFLLKCFTVHMSAMKRMCDNFSKYETDVSTQTHMQNTKNEMQRWN